MSLRILVDENTSPKLITRLEETSIDAVHVLETVGAGSSDEEIAAYAESNGYAVLSHDTDFVSSTHAEQIPVIYYADDTIGIGNLRTKLLAIADVVNSNSDLASVTYLSSW